MNPRRTLGTLAVMTAALALGACDGKSSEVTARGSMTGEELYELWCADCHESGAGHPGTLRLEARLEGDDAVLTKRANDPEIVRFAIRNGFQMMPPFRITEISEEEVERIVNYLAEPQP